MIEGSSSKSHSPSLSPFSSLLYEQWELEGEDGNVSVDVFVMLEEYHVARVHCNKLCIIFGTYVELYTASTTY